MTETVAPYGGQKASRGGWKTGVGTADAKITPELRAEPCLCTARNSKPSRFSAVIGNSYDGMQ